MSDVRKSPFCLLTCALALASAARATTIALADPSEVRVRVLILECSQGSQPTDTCVEQLQAIAADDSSSNASRALAVDALAWIDIQAQDVDLASYFRELAAKRDTEWFLSGPATMARWYLETFASGLSERAQIALLRDLADGRGPEFVPSGVRGWAVDELCARGELDKSVRAAIEKTDGATSPQVIAQCEAAADYLSREHSEPDTLKALDIVDRSFSQAFHRTVMQRALALKSRRADQALASALTVKTGRPAEIAAIGEAVRDLVKRGWSVDQSVALGADGGTRKPLIKSQPSQR